MGGERRGKGDEAREEKRRRRKGRAGKTGSSSFALERKKRKFGAYGTEPIYGAGSASRGEKTLQLAELTCALFLSSAVCAGTRGDE